MRFLLITEARSGTHMLRGVFKTHSDIVGFADYRNDLVGAKGGLVGFLTNLYSGVPAESIFGAFTHFGEVRRRSQIEMSGWIKEDWKSLGEIHDHVITLTRRCILRRYLSLELARKKNDPNWSCDTPRNSNPPPLDFSLDEFLGWHHKTKQLKQEISKLLKPNYSIVYEDLVNDWVGTMRGVYDHLGLQWDNPRASSFQQETRPLEDIVKDWDLALRNAAIIGVDLLNI